MPSRQAAHAADAANGLDGASAGLGQTALPVAGPSNPVKAFGGYLDALNGAIRSLVADLEEQRIARGRQEALSQQEIDRAVEGILEKLPAYENAQDVVRASLEKSLEAMVLNLVSCLFTHTSKLGYLSLADCIRRTAFSRNNALDR
jgi:hypothetical protein